MFHRSLNYSDMAKLCGISLTTVSRLYNHKKCTPATIKKILRGLQISMDDFLEFSLPGDHFAKLSMRSSSEEA
jgi:DNA-binding Xre family transcriptional regulator